MSVEPKYIVALIAVIIFAIYLKISNPYREYGTSAYWQNATIESIQDIPEGAFAPGNKNGPLLLWAAGDVSDPAIIMDLVKRGADINEVDGIFMGTPLSAAAADSDYPEIIQKIVELGGDINARVLSDNTILITAAISNHNPEIIKTLVSLGSRLDDTNEYGQTALDVAISENNAEAEKVLLELKRNQ